MLISIVTFILSLTYMVVGREWYVSPGFFPFLISMFLFLSSLIIIIQELKKITSSQSKQINIKKVFGKIKDQLISNKKVIIAMIISVVYVNVMQTIGFFI